MSDRQRQQLEGIRQRHRLRLLLAFGSRVRDTVHPASDLDIAVLADARPASPSRLLLDVAAELDAVFPSEKLDLALLNGADPLLLGEVSANCRLLAGDVSRSSSVAVNQPLVERKISLVLADVPRVAELAALGVETCLADPRNEVLAGG